MNWTLMRFRKSNDVPSVGSSLGFRNRAQILSARNIFESLQVTASITAVSLCCGYRHDFEKKKKKKGSICLNKMHLGYFSS